MGNLDDLAASTRKAAKTRGTTKNSDRLAAFAEGGKKGSADWVTCDAERLLSVVVGITTLGGAVTFGMSRNEGAYSVTLLLDDKRKTMWFNGDADVDEELQAIVSTLASLQ